MARMSKWRDGYGETPRQPSNYVLALSLAANTAESFDITAARVVDPAVKYVVFSCTGNFYASPFTTATVPGDTTNGTASELNPSGWMIDPACTAISVISPGACVITASFYH